MGEINDIYSKYACVLAWLDKFILLMQSKVMLLSFDDGGWILLSA